jgi:hypothetical protein
MEPMLMLGQGERHLVRIRHEYRSVARVCLLGATCSVGFLEAIYEFYV